jgi:hypothetical protein
VITWLLAFLLAFQPLVVEVVRAETNAAIQTVRNEKARFDKTYQEIMNLQPVKIDWLTAKTLCAADSLQGHKWGTLEAKIKQANEAIAKAKEQARQAKTTLDLEAAKATALATANEGVKENLTNTTKAKALLQQGLREVGSALKFIGDFMSATSLVLGVAYATLAVIGAVTTFGILTAALTPLLMTSTALGIVGASLAAAGQSLIDASVQGANTDHAVLIAIGSGVATGVVTGLLDKVAPGANRIVGKAASRVLSKLAGRSVKITGTLAGDLFNAITNHTRLFDRLVGRAMNLACREVLGTGISRGAYTVYDAMTVQAANQARQDLLREGTIKAINIMCGQAGLPTSVAGKIAGDLKKNIVPAANVLRGMEPTPTDPVAKKKPGLTIPNKSGQGRAPEVR